MAFEFVCQFAIQDLALLLILPGTRRFDHFSNGYDNGLSLVVNNLHSILLLHVYRFRMDQEA